MTTNYSESTHCKSWLFTKEEMESKYKENMENFSKKADETMKLINHLCKIKQLQRENQPFHSEMSKMSFPKELLGIVIPGENSRDFKNGHQI